MYAGSQTEPGERRSAAGHGRRRVFEILDTDSEVRDGPEAMTMLPFSREIEFRDVRFFTRGRTSRH